FTITNPASFALTGVAFTDPLPAGLVVSTPPSISGSCGGLVTAAAGASAITLTGGTIAGLGNCTFSVSVTALTVGAKLNTTGSVTTNETVVDGVASATLTVVAPVAPTITKAFTPGSIALNGT